MSASRSWSARFAILLLLALPLSGCSRTITWEEEVPLNTGETIWIERSMPWEPLGAMGNPFDIAMRPTMEQTIRFKYRGQEYVYSGRANVLWLAISPQQVPVLVAPAADYGWYSQHNYYCVVPYYVQLVPDASGKTWTWPEQIEPWLYELPANVMTSIPLLKESRKNRYRTEDRDKRDAIYRVEFPPGKRIDRTYTTRSCISRWTPNDERNPLTGETK